jgi:hypothetical protein
MGTTERKRVMPYSTSELWVVYYVHTDPYSFDTDMPGEVYLTQAEAQTACDEFNSHPKTFSWERERPWAVGTLYDRMENLRDESRREGELERDADYRDMY